MTVPIVSTMETELIKTPNAKSFLLTSTLTWIDQNHHDHLSSIHELLDTKVKVFSCKETKPSDTILPTYTAYITCNSSAINYKTVHESSQFICQICDKAFSRKPSYERHQQKVHFSEKNKRCASDNTNKPTLKRKRVSEMDNANKVSTFIPRTESSRINDLSGIYELMSEDTNINVEESIRTNRPVTRNNVQITHVKIGSQLAKKSTGGCKWITRVLPTVEHELPTVVSVESSKSTQRKRGQSRLKTPTSKLENKSTGSTKQTKGNIDTIRKNSKDGLYCNDEPISLRNRQRSSKSIYEGRTVADKSTAVNSQTRIKAKGVSKKSQGNGVVNEPIEFLCWFCPKKFKKRVSYERHQKVHSKDKINLETKMNIKSAREKKYHEESKWSTKEKKLSIKDKEISTETKSISEENSQTQTSEDIQQLFHSKLKRLEWSKESLEEMSENTKSYNIRKKERKSLKEVDISSNKIGQKKKMVLTYQKSNSRSYKRRKNSKESGIFIDSISNRKYDNQQSFEEMQLSTKASKKNTECRKICVESYMLSKSKSNNDSNDKERHNELLENSLNLLLKSKANYKKDEQKQSARRIGLDDRSSIQKTLPEIVKHSTKKSNRGSNKHMVHQCNVVVNKIFKCSDCSDFFPTSQKLQVHIKTHTSMNLEKYSEIQSCKMKSLKRLSIAHAKAVMSLDKKSSSGNFLASNDTSEQKTATCIIQNQGDITINVSRLQNSSFRKIHEQKASHFGRIAALKKSIFATNLSNTAQLNPMQNRINFTTNVSKTICLARIAALKKQVFATNLQNTATSQNQTNFTKNVSRPQKKFYENKPATLKKSIFTTKHDPPPLQTITSTDIATSIQSIFTSDYTASMPSIFSSTDSSLPPLLPISSTNLATPTTTINSTKSEQMSFTTTKPKFFLASNFVEPKKCTSSKMTNVSLPNKDISTKNITPKQKVPSFDVTLKRNIFGATPEQEISVAAIRLTHKKEHHAIAYNDVEYQKAKEDADKTSKELNYVLDPETSFYEELVAPEQKLSTTAIQQTHKEEHNVIFSNDVKCQEAKNDHNETSKGVTYNEASKNLTRNISRTQKLFFRKKLAALKTSPFARIALLKKSNFTTNLSNTAKLNPMQNRITFTTNVSRRTKKPLPIFTTTSPSSSKRSISTTNLDLPPVQIIASRNISTPKQSIFTSDNTPSMPPIFSINSSLSPLQPIFSTNFATPTTFTTNSTTTKLTPFITSFVSIKPKFFLASNFVEPKESICTAMHVIPKTTVSKTNITPKQKVTTFDVTLKQNIFGATPEQEISAVAIQQTYKKEHNAIAYKDVECQKAREDADETSKGLDYVEVPETSVYEELSVLKQKTSATAIEQTYKKENNAIVCNDVKCLKTRENHDGISKEVDYGGVHESFFNKELAVPELKLSTTSILQTHKEERSIIVYDDVQSQEAKEDHEITRGATYIEASKSHRRNVTKTQKRFFRKNLSALKTARFARIALLKKSTFSTNLSNTATLMKFTTNVSRHTKKPSPIYTSTSPATSKRSICTTNLDLPPVQTIASRNIATPIQSIFTSDTTSMPLVFSINSSLPPLQPIFSTKFATPTTFTAKSTTTKLTPFITSSVSIEPKLFLASNFVAPKESTMSDIQETVEAQMADNVAESKLDFSYFKCFLCNEKFHNKNQLHKIHFPFECLTCSSSFIDNTGLENHNRRYNKYKCSACNKGNILQSDIHEHKEKHVINGDELMTVELQKIPCKLDFECPVCRRVFDMVQFFIQHMKRFHIEHKCKYCGKQFLKSHQSKEHERNHEKRNDEFVKLAALKNDVFYKKMFKCVYCDSSFERLNNLLTHIKTCKDCSLNLKSLKIHEAIDKDSQKKFSIQSSAVNSFGNDTNTIYNPTYECYICNITCPDNDESLFLKHYLIHFPFECLNCTSSFMDSTGLENHRKRYNKYSCFVCKKKNILQSELEDHKEKHFNDGIEIIEDKIRKMSCSFQFECPVCRQVFTMEHNFTYHMKTAHLEQKCKYCGKVFDIASNLRKHELYHEKRNENIENIQNAAQDIKMYKCIHCKESFEDIISLLTHTKTHTDIEVVKLKKSCITLDNDIQNTKKTLSARNLKSYSLRGRQNVCTLTVNKEVIYVNGKEIDTISCESGILRNGNTDSSITAIIKDENMYSTTGSEGAHIDTDISRNSNSNDVDSIRGVINVVDERKTNVNNESMIESNDSRMELDDHFGIRIRNKNKILPVGNLKKYPLRGRQHVCPLTVNKEVICVYGKEIDKISCENGFFRNRNTDLSITTKMEDENMYLTTGSEDVHIDTDISPNTNTNDIDSVRGAIDKRISTFDSESIIEIDDSRIDVYDDFDIHFQIN